MDDLGVVRELLEAAYDADGLDTLVFDLFPALRGELSSTLKKSRKVMEIVGYADRQGQREELLSYIKKHNPRKYKQFAGRLGGMGGPAVYATREQYLGQMAARYRDLDFVGIPELKDRNALSLEQVFIQLQAEVEREVAELEAMLRGGSGEYAEEGAEESEERGARGEEQRGKSEAWMRREVLGRGRVVRPVSANEAIQENMRLVILGDPGAGKTTLLKYVTLAFAEGASGRLGLAEERLPIFVRLYDYVAKKAGRPQDYSLVDYLYTQAHEYLALQLRPGFFEGELEAGRCCVCLDGLDELGGAGLRREVTAAVEGLRHRYPQNRYLISSRVVGYEEAPLDRRDYAHHTVRPFSDGDIQQFVQKWYLAREKSEHEAKERANHLIGTIMGEARLKELASNPLMLTIIALVHRIEAELPHERVKLYEKCVGALVETWDKAKRLSEGERERPYYKYCRRLLEQLAYWMHSQPGTTGRAREVKEGTLAVQLTRFLLENPKLGLDEEAARQEARAFIELAKARTGLLVERGEGVYAFAHLTFQEYLAAVDIEKRCVYRGVEAIWEEMKERLHDAHWREVLLLLLGSLNRYDELATILVRRIYETTDRYESVLHRHLYLTARVLADRVELDAALRDEIVGQLVRIVLQGGLMWLDALNSLSKLFGNNQAVHAVLTLASNVGVPAGVRCKAAMALGQLGQGEEAARLLVGLVRDREVDSWYRGEAATALQELGREEATGALLWLLRDRKVIPYVQRRAVEALGKLGGGKEEVVGELLKLLQDVDVDDLSRSAAAVVLVQLGQEEMVVEVLIGLARDKNLDASTRSEAVVTLGELGRGKGSTAVLLGLAVDSNEDASVRCAAALALGRLGQEAEATKMLLELERERKVAVWVRREVAGALEQLGRREEGAKVLLKLAMDKEVGAFHQSWAAATLGWLGRGETTEALLGLAIDREVDASVRHAAAVALRLLGRGAAATEVLLELAKDRKVDASVRHEAATALGELDQKEEAAKLLLELAIDRMIGASVRQDAAAALVQLGQEEEAVHVLLELMWDKEVDSFVRGQAATALGQLKREHEMIVESLLTMIGSQSEDVQVRHRAYESLKALLGGFTIEGA